MKQLLYIFIFLLGLTGFGQNENLFEEGKELYKNGKYQQAITSWMKIIDQGLHSPELYFNLGNAHYKMNNIGPSVYYFEKAKLLAPNDTDIKTNLAFAENARIDAIEPLPKTIFSKWRHAISDIFTFNGWAVIAVVFSIVFVCLFLLYYFSISEKRKRLLFVSSLFSILLLFGALTMAFITYSDFNQYKPAIIFSEEIEIKTEPNMSSNVAFTLHEGTKVHITAKDGNWYRISLIDGKDGWIPASDLKQL